MAKETVEGLVDPWLEFVEQVVERANASTTVGCGRIRELCTSTFDVWRAASFLKVFECLGQQLDTAFAHECFLLALQCFVRGLVQVGLRSARHAAWLCCKLLADSYLRALLVLQDRQA